MRYSQMTPGQRKLLLDDPENYPLRVSFLGKIGLLMLEQIAFLRENRVDFDVDDRQAAEVLGDVVVGAAAGREAAREHGGGPGMLRLGAALLTALWMLARRLFGR